MLFRLPGRSLLSVRYIVPVSVKATGYTKLLKIIFFTYSFVQIEGSEGLYSIPISPLSHKNWLQKIRELS